MLELCVVALSGLLNVLLILVLGYSHALSWFVLLNVAATLWSGILFARLLRERRQQRRNMQRVLVWEEHCPHCGALLCQLYDNWSFVIKKGVTVSVCSVPGAKPGPDGKFRGYPAYGTARHDCKVGSQTKEKV